MRVSVTATRAGLTNHQLDMAEVYLSNIKPSALVHGGAMGGDDDLDTIAARRGIVRIIFPSTHRRALPKEHFTSKGGSLIWHPAKPPLERNHDIVRAGDLLLVFPKGPREERRSGTWAAYRFARKHNHRLEVVWPVQKERV